MEAMTSECGLQADERMRDSISFVGTVLRMSAWADWSSTEEEEEEIVEAEKRLARVTEQIALGDTDDSLETMEDIMQLERVTVAMGDLEVEIVDNAGVNGFARRMQWCWISAIGYHTNLVPALPQDQRVWNNVRSYRMTVQGGSRDPIPNK